MKRLARCLALTVFLSVVGSRADAQVTPPGPPVLGRFRTVLTPSSPTGCTNIETGPGFIVALINTGPALTVNPQFYDEGLSPTCNPADLIYGDGTQLTQIQAGQIILLSLPTTVGIAYKISGGALPSTNNLVITRI